MTTLCLIFAHGSDRARELRILRITPVDDPNAELLHWTQVMELEKRYLSAASESRESQTEAGDCTKSEAHWEKIAAQAFFELSIAISTKQRFLGRSDRGSYDETLLEILESILLQQTTSGSEEASVISFSTFFSSPGPVAMASVLGMGLLRYATFSHDIQDRWTNTAKQSTRTRESGHCNSLFVSCIEQGFCSWRMMRRTATFC